MKLYTLIEHKYKLEKAEIEIELIPGIPQIHFLGLPDQAIKESFFRIKSAFKQCGFKFPQAQQVIVNIKPSHLKKSSKGLELAVALGILEKTGQKNLSEAIKKSIIYGELNLDGTVSEPKDLFKFAKANGKEEVVTGLKNPHSFVRFRLAQLDFDIEENSQPVGLQNKMQRPILGLEKNYSADEAEMIFLMSVTGFHTLLAGSAGFGKSTLAKNYISFMPAPTPSQAEYLSQQDEIWRCVVAPHHSVTAAAFLGGGAQLYQGEVERAHYGLLILDEFLEFQPQILETLRGPMTGEKLRLSRAGVVREFDCDFQVVATTNLCPCGKWTPKEDISCRYSRLQCTKYLNKLSGPIIDRFGLLMFYKNQKPKREVTGYKILERIEKFNNLKSIQSSRVDLSFSNSTGQDQSGVPIIFEKLYADVSLRRQQFILSVAQIYQFERESSKLELSDLNKAEKWTLKPFLELEKGM